MTNDDDVKRHLGVEPRPGSRNWQFKRKAPDDLAHLYPSGWARRCTLGTADLAEANRKAARIWAETEDEFAAHRRRLNPVTVSTVTPELAATLVQAIRHRILSGDDQRRDSQADLIAFLAAWEEVSPSRRRHYLTEPGRPAYLTPNPDGPLAGLSGAQRQRLKEVHALIVASMASVRAGRNLAAVVALADAESRRLGFCVDWTAPDNREALRQCLDAMVDAWEASADRDLGRHIATPVAPPAPEHRKAAAKEPSIANALDAWKRKGRRPDKTITSFTAHALTFARLMGDPPLRTLNRQAAIRFRDLLQQEAINEKKTATTANNILTSVKTLANVARDEGWIEGEPFGRLVVSVGGAETEQREPWTAAELVRLFDSPIFRAYDVPRSPAKAGLDAAYWLPLIAACTGARPSEIAQLWTDDVSELPGGLVVEFRANEQRGQRLKNKVSWRAIPIHSALIRLGFADYWRAVSVGGPRLLFPALPVRSINGAGAQFGTWFGDYKRARGFTSPTKTLHSFRHSIETELAHAGVPTQLVDAITGHAGQGTGRKVYAATIRRDAERLRPWIERLAYLLPDGTDALALPRVFDEPAWTPKTARPRKTRATR